MELSGKCAVVTGASTGIGYEIMKMLLEKGVKVIAVSRSISKIDYNHENLHKYDADLSSGESVDKLFDYALEKFGDIDLFMANAGFAFFEEIEKPDWEHLLKIFNVNVFSYIYALEKMKELHGGKPFNFLMTASAMGFVSLPGYALYSSTKAALRGFADSYRYELRNGQHLQVLFPIATITPFFKAAGDIPVSWPVQSAECVARKTVKAIEKNKDNIFPSRLFKLFRVMSAVCPPLIKVYNKINERKFRDYLKK